MKLAILAVLLTFSSSLIAHETGSDEKKEKRRGPPAVAIEACVAAVEGDACSFISPWSEDEVTGICVVRREQTVCKPDKAFREARRELWRKKREASE